MAHTERSIDIDVVEHPERDTAGARPRTWKATNPRAHGITLAEPETRAERAPSPRRNTPTVDVERATGETVHPSS